MEGSAKRITKFEGASFSYEPSFDAARFAISSLASGKSAHGIPQGFDDVWVSGFGSAAIERRFGRVLHVELDLLGRCVYAQSGVEARSHACRRNEKTVRNYARWNRPGAKKGKGGGETPKELSHVSPSGGPLRRTPGRHCKPRGRSASRRLVPNKRKSFFVLHERVHSIASGQEQTSSWGDSTKLSVGVRISPRKSRTGFVVFPMT